jgi:hypothetical protein
MQGKAQAHERQFKCDLYSPSFCASLNHLLIRLEILIFIKTAPNSLIIVFASMVFPVPGGPYNNTPFCGPRSFSCEKSSGFRRGRITSSYKACLIDSNHPIDSKIKIYNCSILINH